MKDPGAPPRSSDVSGVLSRRAALGGLAGLALGCRPRAGDEHAASARPGVDRRPDRAAEPSPPMTTPALFVAHGAPTLALDPVAGADFARWGQALPRPEAVLVLSAHWESAPPTIGATSTRPLVYDFYGFPPPLYEVRYPAPGAPALAERLAGLLPELRRQPERGLDHGAWVPLVHLWPDADVPVLQLSLPSELGPRALIELGRRLAPLRREGVLLIGSGNLTHNLRRLGFGSSAAPEGWASEFDAWCADALARHDLDALADWGRAPGARLSHPTAEHFLPLLVTAGAAADDPVRFPISGFEHQNLSRRSVQLG